MVDLTARSRVIVSVIAAGLTGAVLWILQLRDATVFVAAWIAYAGCFLLLAWSEMLAEASARSQRAVEQDAGGPSMFVAVVTATCASLVAVLLLLGRMKGMVDPAELIAHLLLSLLAVGCSWGLLHTVFTFRYASLFYLDARDSKDRGMVFPHERKPDYLDFAYFSFVIGMTFQVSDVQVTSHRIRRLAFLHGVLSFMFNTLVVAVTINIIAGLL